MNRRLIQAACSGDVDYLVKEIDNNPFTLHAVALEGGETLLHIACFAGHVNFAAAVIKVRQEFCRELNQDGFSPLHIAAACGHVEIVKELLKVDFGLCLIKGKNRKIPLHLAVIKGKIEVVTELLFPSCDSVDCVTAQNETSLHLAVKNNQFESFQVLIRYLKQFKKEYLLNCKDCKSNTILHLAVSRKQYEVVNFLLNEQVISTETIELNSLNNDGLTPLDMLRRFQSEDADDDIEECLVQAGALKSENLQNPQEEERPNLRNTTRENPPSPARQLLDDFFKYNHVRDSPTEVRNALLMIVVLITSATYQPALSPPGGTWQDNSTPSIRNNTISSATATKPHTAGEDIMGSNKPIAYTIFMFANSLGFYTSIHMMYILTAAFPLRLEFNFLIIALVTSYSTCMGTMLQKGFLTYAFIGISVALLIIIQFTTVVFGKYLQGPRNVSPYTVQETDRAHTMDISMHLNV
ncbi:unnamed protein product [Lactuca virosa]|uniref:PGG domain-containing protein n=1 Tax=Lactuca virosa TaxID=75947 RepID=A0AAU9NTB7_9ASTR|nr:unnamed protein product [Lactuca virosa]